MSITTNILGCIIGIGLCMEIGARIYYKNRFRLPWHSKSIGEYPYNEFLEKADPPLYFQFKRGFCSKLVNINSFGMRSSEPETGKNKKKLLLIGESLFFGSKLLNEKGLWCYQLEKILKNNGINNWDILNAGFPGYNVIQYLTWWQNTLKSIKPDILLIQMGLNDITQAYVFGDKWQPGMSWPLDFILKQQKKSKWWKKFLFHSCLYFVYRRKKITERKGFESNSNVFKYNECKDIILEKAMDIINQAKGMGSKVILTTGTMAYSPDSLKEAPPQLDTIQSNWRESLKTTGLPMIEFSDFWVNEFSSELSATGLNFMELFWNHPRRYEMYLDVVHWNETGHKVAANAIFNKIKNLGWWQ